ncbi:hypothetical protein [Rhodohalobacter sp. 614A]|uniref:hypothetical protein n=1 Tax=Rhodohalobacter sp. 614A TaxID=2908649 RepID=UPI001F29A9E5|nr:hypothetical protein [Rhodohalobacter sp. 614A]
MGRVCTDELRIIVISVLSSEEEPIVFDQMTITNLETGRVLNICEAMGSYCETGKPLGQPEKGRYTIFHDGLKDEISGEKSKILVEGSNEMFSIREEFVIGNDGCHIYKDAGPDTIVVEVE